MLAPLVAPALGAGILRFANWHVMFGFIALFGLACLAASWRLPESLPVERRHRHGVGAAMRGYGSLLRQRQFLVPAFVAAFASGTLMSYLSSSSVVFMGEYGLSTTVFPVVFALMAGCFLLGVRLNITLLRHYRLHVLLQAYLLVAVAALVALVLLVLVGAPLWTLFVAIGAVKVCLGGTLPNATAETMEPFARNAGAASALLGTVQMGFAGLLAAVLAALAFTPSLEMGVAMLATAVVAAGLARIRRT
jgi:DHA1 family bicyclomycin/chloramphenicol resistance-like MFS transporter